MHGNGAGRWGRTPILTSKTQLDTCVSQSDSLLQLRISILKISKEIMFTIIGYRVGSCLLSVLFSLGIGHVYYESCGNRGYKGHRTVDFEGDFVYLQHVVAVITVC